MNDSLSPLPLMDVAMLRSDSDFPLNGEDFGFSRTLRPTSIRHKPFHDRFMRCAGLIFEVPELTSRGKRGTDWEATRIYLAAVLAEGSRKLSARPQRFASHAGVVSQDSDKSVNLSFIAGGRFDVAEAKGAFVVIHPRRGLYTAAQVRCEVSRQISKCPEGLRC